MAFFFVALGKASFIVPFHPYSLRNKANEFKELARELRYSINWIQHGIKFYEIILSKIEREQYPEAWAITQFLYGTACLRLCNSESHSGWFNENNDKALKALKAYGTLVEDDGFKEQYPHVWARAMHNRGVLFFWGGMTYYLETNNYIKSQQQFLQNTLLSDQSPSIVSSAQKRFDDAENLPIVKHELNTLEWLSVPYLMSLEKLNRKETPVEWAMTQHNLGQSQLYTYFLLRDLKKLEKIQSFYSWVLTEAEDNKNLPQSDAFKEKIKEALTDPETDEEQIAILKRAIESFSLALEVRTEQRCFEQAATQYALGHALRALGEVEDKEEHWSKAYAAFDIAFIIWLGEEPEPIFLRSVKQNRIEIRKWLAEAQ